MERTLTDFIRALRAAGAPVSSAEAIDAARTLALIGFDDRQRMKDSLGLVLAKSEEEKLIHDQMFEIFFKRKSAASSAASKEGKDSDNQEDRSGSQDTSNEAGDKQQGARPGVKQEGAKQGGSSQGGSGSDHGDPRASEGSEESFYDLAFSGDADRIAAALERAGAEAGVDDIRFATQQAFFVRQMLERLGVETFDQLLSGKMNDPARKAQAEAKKLIAARANIQKLAREYVEQRFELFGRSATDNFMNEVVANREIAQIGLRDMERMKAMVARMAKRLAVRHSRRRKVRNRGQLDMRRTMRANAGHDGVPFELVWKYRRKDRPKIVAVCDVSGSVSRYVRFLLLFLYALKDEVTDLSAFAFSARLKDVGRELESMSFEAAMDHIVLEMGSGGTDYGQALQDLQDQYWDTIDRRTTVLILGDGRSNQADPRLDIFQEAAARAKRVVWLCPEPPGRWGTGDSCVLEYKPFCTTLSYCATALDLERAIDEVLAAYD
jgi:uncharacterized protein